MGPSRTLRVLAILCISSLVVSAGELLAGEPDRCCASKLRTTGKRAKRLLRCEARAAASASPVHAACIEKAKRIFDERIAAVESIGECRTEQDADVLGGDVNALIGTILDSLGGIPEPLVGGCAARALRATGAHAKRLATCAAKAARQRAGVDEACLEDPRSRLADAVAAAAAKDDCRRVPSAEALGRRIESFVRNLSGRLVTVCGDGIIGPGESCDAGRDAACSGRCLPNCQCGGDCGNGVVDSPTEECDDGGNADGDGCTSSCVLEDVSALCAGILTTQGTTISSRIVAEGFFRPVFVTAPPLDTRRLFVVEQSGKIHIVKDGVRKAVPFLDIEDRAVGPKQANEVGLFSMAFHPGYANNGRFFVNYTREAPGVGDTVIARYSVSDDPDIADRDSEEILLVIDQPVANHNGGQLAFDSNGYLFTAMGDGGGGGDPFETAQDDSSLLGKILRFDVDVESPPYYAVPADNPDGAAGEPLGLIWARGLRNPWRFSFDRMNDDLYIGDVGQGTREEIDYAPRTSRGGENYGWDIFEGTSCHEPAPALDCPEPPVGFTAPIHEYPRTIGRSVTGGYVYRGCALPDLRGTYFYGDFRDSFVRTFVVENGSAVNHSNVTTAFGGVTGVSSFGEDARGELYVLGFDGTVRKMIGSDSGQSRR